MADIVPFKGILYNTEKIGDIADVVTPPYDVISESGQEAFYHRHPNNVIRLDKNRAEPDDTEIDNVHTRAAACFRDWQEDKILVRDPEPALYLTSVRFAANGWENTRLGLIARVRLEPFDTGMILPHEKTFSKVKTDRLALIKACHANFSQVFSIFSDSDDVLGMLGTATAKIPPVFSFDDDEGHHHRMWRITDSKLHDQVNQTLKERRLYIADGHHRYETALNYLAWRKQQHPSMDNAHPANFIMMYLAAMEDPGLIILPAHRLVSEIPTSVQHDFIDRAGAWFDIAAFPFDPARPETSMAVLDRAMKAKPGGHKFGVFIKNAPDFYVLDLKPGVMASVFGHRIPAPLLELDVTVLTHLIFFELLGLDETMLDNENKIAFTSRDSDALSAVSRKKCDMAFMLNPTTNDQVKTIAESGLIMPRKSTFFYPKAITGLVMNTLRDD
jgi:uncharacterized protein (DUF1015 family)